MDGDAARDQKLAAGKKKVFSFAPVKVNIYTE
jgi:hypothetical protein